MLLDRLEELAALRRPLEAVRNGRSSALVMRGEPGVGKTALLDYAIESSAGLKIARIAGVESEMELAFAALQQLCAPMLDRLERLPEPQRRALDVAFGLSSGAAPDRFLVGTAVLSLLADAAQDRPLACVIDDAQWLDQASAQALAFVARRLLAESVALVFVTRKESLQLRGLPELVVSGLSDADARALLRSVATGPLDDRVRDRIIAETRGNPLALLELPRRLTPAQLAGGFGGLDAPLSSWIQEAFRERYEALPVSARLVVLIAAAEPTGDPVLLWRAAAQLEIGAESAATAESDGLLQIAARVVFQHPLARSAVYQAAPVEQRRAAHWALAVATDPLLDPDRRAWHLAHATAGLADEVADELERSAGRAQARGGLAAAAAFLNRSATMTSDPAHRAERALAAAQANCDVGAFDVALKLVASAESGPLNRQQEAHAALLRGQITFTSLRGSEAPPLLIRAARKFEPLDARLAREAYLEALSAALFAGRLGAGDSVLEVARAALGAPRALQPVRATDLLLDGLAVLITDGGPAGAPLVKRAVGAFCSADIPLEEGRRWLWLACHAAIIAWDHETWQLLSTRQVELARRAGALAMLPVALNSLSAALAWTGDFAVSRELITEAQSITTAIGASLPPYAALPLAAWQGREAKAKGLIETSRDGAVARGEGMGLASIEWATALLCNGLGRYEDALEAAQQGSEHPQELWSNLLLPELIEAAVHSGQTGLAEHALDRLSQTTRPAGTDWALGTQARSEALLRDGDAAERLYREAVERLGRTRLRPAAARARLVCQRTRRDPCRRT